MKKKAMTAAIESRINKADHYYALVLEGYAIEDIHRFRVETKKIRAFFRLVGTGSKAPSKFRLPKEIKRFYRAVGNIRILQLQMQMIAKMSAENEEMSPGSYLATLEQRAAVNMRKAKKISLGIRSLKTEMQKLVRNIPSDLDASTTKKFIDSEFGVLLGVLHQQDPTEESLHLARKIMKEIYYDWTYVESIAASVLPPAIRKKEDMEKFTDLLGSFHDACVAIALLDKITTLQRTSEDELIMLLNIRKEWEGEKDEIRKKLLTNSKNISAAVPVMPDLFRPGIPVP